MINIYQPQVGQEELDAIKKVFDSNWLGKGKVTEEFTQQLADKLNVDRKNVETVSTCTEALFEIMRLIGITRGDEVIIPSIHFIGAVNAIESYEGTPKFCDVDKRTMNVTLEDIKPLVNSKTKAVMLLHYAGRPIEDIFKIVTYCNELGIKVIEDNANSPFSKINNINTGVIGDYGTWSFDAMKILVTGDGGLLYCRDKKDIEKFKQNSYLGLMSKSGYSNNQSNKWWEFEISGPGKRTIINDITAAIGIEQLKKVDRFISQRQGVHSYYNVQLRNLDWLEVPPLIDAKSDSSFYMYHLQCKEKGDRDKLAKHLKDNDIYTTFRYYPLHEVPYYKEEGIHLPNTEYIMNHTICIPIHQSLEGWEINHIIKQIKNFK